MTFDFYIGSPYTGTPEEERFRWEEATKVAGKLIAIGRTAYSPISYGRPIATMCKLAGNFKTWKKMSLNALEASACMIVLKLPGWESSVGLKEEVSFASLRRIPVLYMTPEDIDNYIAKEIEDGRTDSSIG